MLTTYGLPLLRWLDGLWHAYVCPMVELFADEKFMAEDDEPV